jgi:hypothetical protein
MRCIPGPAIEDGALQMLVSGCSLCHRSFSLCFIKFYHSS